MLIFIQNKPRAYAWGSRDALAEMLGTEPAGEPQAELWLGAHPGDPAEVAKATPAPHTLIDLIESDPEQYGVDGGPLPFLLKVLAIGAPLSLQVHPDVEQARAGFAREERLGAPRDARERNYRDPNHKPELLVALGEVRALAGFRPLGDAVRDLDAFAASALEAGDAGGAEALRTVAARLGEGEPEAARRAFIEWAFSGDALVDRALSALGCAGGTDPDRAEAVLEIAAKHPGDPGALVALLLHLVRLEPGEAIYLPPRQLHAYLSGVAMEVMAASDNVLRAGLTVKHIDVPELRRVLDAAELDDPRCSSERIAPGLVAWRPPVPDFVMLRARVCGPETSRSESGNEGAAESVSVPAPAPIVLIVTAGRVRVERLTEDLDEVASARRGQSLYVSAGAPIELTGHGEVFLATVGRDPRR